MTRHILENKLSIKSQTIINTGRALVLCLEAWPYTAHPTYSRLAVFGSSSTLIQSQEWAKILGAGTGTELIGV